MTANYDQPDVVEKRVRFFDGQFLQDQDFVDEQIYHLDRERRPLRLLYVAGIADGLDVTAGSPNQVTVAPGTAVDGDGRQLALAQAATVDLPAEKFNDKQGAEIYISFSESPEDEQTEAGSADFTRWLERPQCTALAPGDSYAGATPPVLLATVALDNAGRVTIDETVRSYSGVRLPGPSGDASSLRSTSGGQVAMEGSLSIDGNVGLGAAATSDRLTVEGNLTFTNTTASTISSAARLHISGEEILYLLNKSGVIVGKEWGGTGGLTVEGDLAAGGAASVTGNLSVSGNVGLGAAATSDRVTVEGNLTFTNTTASTISSAARLHISGEEILYLLNKSGVIVGKEWGGTGGLTVEGDLAAGGAASVTGNLSVSGAASVTGNLSVTGNAGLGTAKPSAQLSVVAPKASEITGTAQSPVLRTSAGTLDTAQGGELPLSSTGLTVGTNSVSLGVRAIRTAKGSDWTTSALGLGMDVDNTVRAGAALFLHANGNVGIGSSSPNSDLQIGDFQSRNRYLTFKVSGGNAYSSGLKLWTFVENFGYSIEFDERNTTGNGLHIRTHDTLVAGQTNVYAASDGTSRIFVGRNGNVGVGTTVPTTQLSVEGDLSFLNTTASTISSAARLHISGPELLYLLNKSGVVVGKEWGGNGNLLVEGALSQASDARLKRGIKRLESTLDKLAAIRGVTYIPRQVGETASQLPVKPAIGVIAQEVEAVFPELVSTIEGRQYKGVEYGGLTAVLLEAVKELKAALDPLLDRVAALEARA